MTAWMELESIVLSEISQAAKVKYHMISSISGTYINKTNKQAKYKERDIEVKKQTDSNQRRGQEG